MTRLAGTTREEPIYAKWGLRTIRPQVDAQSVIRQEKESALWSDYDHITTGEATTARREKMGVITRTCFRPLPCNGVTRSLFLHRIGGLFLCNKKAVCQPIPDSKNLPRKLSERGFDILLVYCFFRLSAEPAATALPSNKKPIPSPVCGSLIDLTIPTDSFPESSFVVTLNVY